VPLAQKALGEPPGFSGCWLSPGALTVVTGNGCLTGTGYGSPVPADYQSKRKEHTKI